MNKLDTSRRTQIISSLVEGNSIRATSRMVGVSKDTVMKLVVDAGVACAEYQDGALRSLPCKRIQCDEIWSFCYAKEKHVAPENKGILGYGDVWTWVSMCADTKLVPCWLVGRRDAHTAMEFIQDLSSRLAHRVQLSTDGNRIYLTAVEEAFGCDIDYAMLVKIYESEQTEVRYSPAKCVSTQNVIISGNPDEKHISTSYIERQNLTMRMSMRRFTRLTNAFSKKVENHAHAIALHYMYYNFVRIHKTLRCTPAMEAGISKTVWSIEDIVNLIQ